MPVKKNKLGLIIKSMFIVFAMMFYFIPDSFGRGEQELLAPGNNSIKFKLYASEGFSDEVLLRVMDNSTFGFDEDLDVIKLHGNAGFSSLYLLADDDSKYEINTIPYVNSSLGIPLNIECTKSGKYTISVSGGVNFEYRYPVTLKDKQLNKFIDLRIDSVYSFFHTPEMNPQRFEIHFNVMEGQYEQQENLQTNVKINPGEVRVTGIDDGSYTANLYTMEGRLISTSKGILSEGISLTSRNNTPGICLLQVTNGQFTFTKKIYIK